MHTDCVGPCGFFGFVCFHHLNYYREIKQIFQKGRGGGGSKHPMIIPQVTTLPAFVTCDL